jgi:GNAT superfamily N-acetyltransferase
MLIEFDKESARCKNKGLRDEKGNQIKKYHYLWFIGTDPEARGQGLASRLVALREEQVAADNVPIWLEATTERSRDVYAKQGFEVVDVMRLGQGTHNADGVPEKGGPGIRIWAMIWKPKKKENGAPAA